MIQLQDSGKRLYVHTIRLDKQASNRMEKLVEKTGYRKSEIIQWLIKNAPEDIAFLMDEDDKRNKNGRSI